MHGALSQALTIALIFVLAGLVKGVAGMGLPTVAIGVLGLLMTPAEAAAFIVIPSLITNVWQYLSGRHHLKLFRRTWSMLLIMAVVTWASAGLIADAHMQSAGIALGVVLVAYAIIGLGKVHLAVPRSSQVWFSPTIGAATGVVTGATGVFVIPAALYLQALGFHKDDLVQVLGLSFTVSTIALAIGLASHGAFHITDAGISALCTVPALAGMSVGQVIRARVDPATFRLIFLIGLLLLGADLIARTFLR